MFKSIQQNLTSSDKIKEFKISNSAIKNTKKNKPSISTFGKLSTLAAIVAASAPTYVQAEKLSESAPAYIPASQVNTWLDGRAEVNFLALQNYQSIQAKDGAFRPADEEQSSGFGRLRVNLQLKFHITDNIRADIDIAEEPNDFGNNGDRDFAFHQD